MLQRSTTRSGALPRSHAGQHDASDPQRRPVGNWVQKSVRHRCSNTPGSSHRSIQALIQDAVCSSRSRSWRRTSPRSSRQLPPTISAHLTVMSKQRRSCVFRRQPRQQMKLGSKQLGDCTGFCRIPQREQSGSSQASLTELCTTGDMSWLSTAGPATTTSTTLRLTQQYQTTMTWSPQRATRMNLCCHQVSNCPVCPRVLSAGDGSPTQ